ncbi:hypothetical protein ASN_2597 [Acetobacter senegalensis]|uniref:Peptidase C45 hydrolase domain-containing protein n=1 Tax=Acetobacter senegalensis TaxID=446692 RepID=A0A0U5EXW4_9PROT|nr:C45 family peptidase [Acetobacter senegalensis]CEF41878.1 hypothetical protein ASN_2597 [Acetobacter senegalensis]
MSSIIHKKIQGSHFEIGLQLGTIGRDTVQSYLINSPNWKFLMNFRKDPRVADIQRQVEYHFPEYYQELKGMADACDVSLNDLFLWNCRGDIFPISGDGCTTVQVPGTTKLVAHNEDGDPNLYLGCAYVTVSLPQGNSFTCFVYPGSIPGHTFGVNNFKLVSTINNIRSQEIGTGIPRMIITRAILDCSNIENALKLLKKYSRAGAFHMTLSTPVDKHIKSVEFTHTQSSSREINSTSVHSNHLIHEKMFRLPQIITASSYIRQKKSENIIRSSFNNPLDVLWNNSDADFPTFRSCPDDPDFENTLSTAVFDIGDRNVNFRFYDRDKKEALNGVI